MKRLPMIFRYEDIKEYYPNKSGFYAFLYRSLNKGNIKQIKKGLYALVDVVTNNVYANKFQIASALFIDSYISYHDALEYYGLANQSFVSSLTYVSHVRVNDLEFDDIIYRSIKNNNALEIIDKIAEEGIRVVSLERAIIDSIDRISLSGGIEEVEHALAICPNLNIEVVKQLLSHYNTIFLYQKVGYLFEKYFNNNIPKEFYELCLSKINNKVQYLSKDIKKPKLNSKWKLMVEDIKNTQLLI